MKAFIEYIKDTTALFLGMFFRVKSERLENLSNEFQGKSTVFKGHTATVIERVSKDSGKVKYAGVVWLAKLEDDNKQKELVEGLEVKVVDIKGKIIFVEPTSPR